MNRRAFTLMEMVLVMAIVALVFAGVFVGMAALNDERALQKPYVELQGMAKTAWQRAMLEQNSQQIVFYSTRFELQPRQAVNEADARFFSEMDKAKGRSSGAAGVDVPEGVRMEVRRWASNEWVKPGDKQPVAWIFDASGLCEPISVRFTSELGSVGAQFDPLTASVKQEIFDGE